MNLIYCNILKCQSKCVLRCFINVQWHCLYYLLYFGTNLWLMQTSLISEWPLLTLLDRWKSFTHLCTGKNTFRLISWLLALVLHVWALQNCLDKCLRHVHISVVHSLHCLYLLFLDVDDRKSFAARQFVIGIAKYHRRLCKKDLRNDIEFFYSPTCLCLGHVIFYYILLLCFVLNDRKSFVKYHKPFV